MVKYHLKRVAAPRTWKITRKSSVFIARPLPGRGSLRLGMPLSTWLKEKLGICSTTSEVSYLIRNNKVLVNQKAPKSHKVPVSLFDVISIPEAKQHFRVVLTKGGYLGSIPITEKESTKKIVKLISKSTLKAGKVHLNFSDGTNLLHDGKLEISTGDSAVLDFKENKILETFKLDKGSVVFFASGSHIAELGIVDSVSGKKAVVKIGDYSKEVEVKSLLVVGKKEPALTIRRDSNGS
jgi:small subunit ribosomal protein S4e